MNKRVRELAEQAEMAVLSADNERLEFSKKFSSAEIAENILAKS